MGKAQKKRCITFHINKYIGIWNKSLFKKFKNCVYLSFFQRGYLAAFQPYKVEILT